MVHQMPPPPPFAARHERPNSPRSPNIASPPIPAHRHRNGGKSVIVMPFRLSYDQAVPFNPIDQPVLQINPLRPPPGKFSFQRLWFSCASEGIAFGFLDQPQQPFGYLGIHLNPILQILESPLPKFQAHASNPPSFQRSSASAFWRQSLHAASWHFSANQAAERSCPQVAAAVNSTE